MSGLDFNGWETKFFWAKHDADAGITYVYAGTEGSSLEQAVAGARFIFDVFRREHEAWLRIEPTGSTETDFETRVIHHRGVVRFAFSDRAGEVHASIINDEVPL